MIINGGHMKMNLGCMVIAMFLGGCSSSTHDIRYMHMESAEYLVPNATTIKQGKLDLSLLNVVDRYDGVWSVDTFSAGMSSDSAVVRMIKQRDDNSILVDASPFFQFVLTYRQCDEEERESGTPCIVSSVDREVSDFMNRAASIRRTIDNLVVSEFSIQLLSL